MIRYSANGSASSASRFLRGGALACLATLMLAALAQPAAANRMVEGVTAELRVADVQCKEGEDAPFVLILSRPLPFDIFYRYRTEDLSAKAGKDYVAENGDIVIPAGTQYMPLGIKTLKDDVIDRNRFMLVLSDPHTKGYGMVWGEYVWTDWWRVEGLPLSLTATADIANALDGSMQRNNPQHNKYTRDSSRRGGGRDQRGGRQNRGG